MSSDAEDVVAAPVPHRRIPRLAAPLAIFVATCVVWATGVRGPYHFDDWTTPLADPASASLTTWVERSLQTLRPLTKLTYAIEATVGLTDNPSARRVVSILLLACTGILLYWLVRRLVRTASPAAAFVAVLVFCVHPVHAESVLELSGRSAALSGLFVVAAILAQTHDRLRLAALLLAAASLARETAIAAALPLLILSLAEPRPLRERVRRLAPLAISVAFQLVWLAATPRARELADFSFNGRPFVASCVQQIAAVPAGVALYFHPGALSIDHGVPLPTSPLSAGFVAGLVLYAAVVAALVFTVRRAPAIATGLALWLAAIVPTQLLVPKLDALTERPLSLALAGVVVVAACGLVRVPRVSLLAVVFIAGLLAMRTIERGALYASDMLLWQDAAVKSVANSRPHRIYAGLLYEAGRLDEARVELEIAHAIDPFDSQTATLLDTFDSAQ